MDIKIIGSIEHSSNNNWWWKEVQTISLQKTDILFTLIKALSLFSWFRLRHNSENPSLIIGCINTRNLCDPTIYLSQGNSRSHWCTVFVIRPKQSIALCITTTETTKYQRGSNHTKTCLNASKHTYNTKLHHFGSDRYDNRWVLCATINNNSISSTEIVYW